MYKFGIIFKLTQIGFTNAKEFCMNRYHKLISKK